MLGSTPPYYLRKKENSGSVQKVQGISSGHRSSAQSGGLKARYPSFISFKAFLPTTWFSLFSLHSRFFLSLSLSHPLFHSYFPLRLSLSLSQAWPIVRIITFSTVLPDRGPAASGKKNEKKTESLSQPQPKEGWMTLVWVVVPTLPPQTSPTCPPTNEENGICIVKLF